MSVLLASFDSMDEIAVTIRPANEASWEDLRAIVGTTGESGRCYCQYFKTPRLEWNDIPPSERAARLRDQTGCDEPDADYTTGLVAYLGEEPVGWCAVEPRTAFPKLLRKSTVWKGRAEAKADDGVWSVVCFVTRKGFRKRGITYPLASASIDFARERGARALEAYTLITEPGREITWGELYVGSRNVFADAGFIEVSRPSLRRVVMRIEFS